MATGDMATPSLKRVESLEGEYHHFNFCTSSNLGLTLPSQMRNHLSSESRPCIKTQDSTSSLQAAHVDLDPSHMASILTAPPLDGHDGEEGMQLEEWDQDSLFGDFDDDPPGLSPDESGNNSRKSSFDFSTPSDPSSSYAPVVDADVRGTSCCKERMPAVSPARESNPFDGTHISISHSHQSGVQQEQPQVTSATSSYEPQRPSSLPAPIQSVEPAMPAFLLPKPTRKATLKPVEPACIKDHEELSYRSSVLLSTLIRLAGPPLQASMNNHIKNLQNGAAKNIISPQLLTLFEVVKAKMQNDEEFRHAGIAFIMRQPEETDEELFGEYHDNPDHRENLAKVISCSPGCRRKYRSLEKRFVTASKKVQKYKAERDEALKKLTRQRSFAALCQGDDGSDIEAPSMRQTKSAPGRSVTEPSDSSRQPSSTTRRSRSMAPSTSQRSSSKAKKERPATRQPAFPVTGPAQMSSTNSQPVPQNTSHVSEPLMGSSSTSNVASVDLPSAYYAHFKLQGSSQLSYSSPYGNTYVAHAHQPVPYQHGSQGNISSANGIHSGLTQYTSHENMFGVNTHHASPQQNCMYVPAPQADPVSPHSGHTSKCQSRPKSPVTSVHTPSASSSKKRPSPSAQEAGPPASPSKRRKYDEIARANAVATYQLGIARHSWMTEPNIPVPPRQMAGQTNSEPAVVDLTQSPDQTDGESGDENNVVNGQYTESKKVEPKQDLQHHTENDIFDDEFEKQFMRLQEQEKQWEKEEKAEEEWLANWPNNPAPEDHFEGLGEELDMLLEQN